MDEEARPAYRAFISFVSPDAARRVYETKYAPAGTPRTAEEFERAKARLAASIARVKP